VFIDPSDGLIVAVDAEAVIPGILIPYGSAVFIDPFDDLIVAVDAEAVTPGVRRSDGSL
jgi:hypothetical protein